MRQLYQTFRLPLQESFAARLRHLAAKARKHRSEHRYDVRDFYLTDEAVQSRFADVWPITAKDVINQERTA